MVLSVLFWFGLVVLGQGQQVGVLGIEYFDVMVLGVVGGVGVVCVWYVGIDFFQV